MCVLQHPDAKMMQINLTGFLNGKNAREFMKDLWPLLLSAQENIAGIPSAFLEQKKEEIRQRQVGKMLISQITLMLYMVVKKQCPFCGNVWIDQYICISSQIEQEKLATLKKVDENKKEKDVRERAQSRSPRRSKENAQIWNVFKAVF